MALSIGNKIFFSFSVVVVVSVSVGVFALERMSAINGQASVIRDKYLPSITKENALALALQQYRIAEARHVMSTDTKDMATVEQELSGMMAAYDQQRSAFTPLIDQGEEENRFKEIDRALVAYRAVHDKVLSASQKNDSATAAALFKGEGKQVFRQLADLYEKDIGYNERQGRAAADQAQQAYNVAFFWVVAAITLMATACAVIGVALIRSISRPIEAMTVAMRRLASADMTTSVPGLARGDEIGAMAAAVQVFKDNMVLTDRLAKDVESAAHNRQAVELKAAAERGEMAEQQSHVVQSLAAGLDKLANGDLIFKLEKAFAPEYDKLRSDFNAAIGKLQDTMINISGSTQSISSGTTEIATASDDLARRTEQQAASLEETAAALDEITATVRKTSEASRQAKDVVGEAKTAAEKSGQVVRQAVEAMSGIEQSSAKIGNIIGVIDEIAFQTSLLALNAGVEAARAGDAGRGFAVVASEVRALAQRSAEAAKEIKTLISASSQQVGLGVDLVGQTGLALDEIVRKVSDINGMVLNIATSTQEQTTALDQVNTAVNQMDQVTQQNAAMVEQSTAASHALARETRVLAGLIGQFDIGEQMSHETQRRAPTAAKAAARPGSKSVAALKTTGRGSAARKPLPANAADEWEEF